jgi:hypothetical protein
MESAINRYEPKLISPHNFENRKANTESNQISFCRPERNMEEDEGTKHLH